MGVYCGCVQTVTPVDVGTDVKRQGARGKEAKGQGARGKKQEAKGKGQEAKGTLPLPLVFCLLLLLPLLLRAFFLNALLFFHRIFQAFAEAARFLGLVLFGFQFG